MALEIGPNVLLNVEEELRPELELAQTLLLQTEELTVSDQVVRPENVTLKDVLVRYGRGSYIIFGKQTYK